MWDEKHMYMDESYKNWMKYLDERGTWMNFWMIIGIYQFLGWNFLDHE
jgi:hypothetical protein